MVFLSRGRSVGLIHLCQAVIVSADLLVVGLLSHWSDVGRYGAPHRMITAVMAFGMIFQQVVFPALSRNWRASPDSGRRLLDFAVRVLVTGFIPVAVGGTLLAEPLVGFLLPAEYHQAGLLLAVGIWKAPLLSLAFLYQAALIATNRESQGLRLLVWGAVCSAPLIALFTGGSGCPGRLSAVLVIGAGAGGGRVLAACRGALPARGASPPGPPAAGVAGHGAGLSAGLAGPRRRGRAGGARYLPGGHEVDRRARVSAPSGRSGREAVAISRPEGRA